jgi:hypothetical protein
VGATVEGRESAKTDTDTGIYSLGPRGHNLSPSLHHVAAYPQLLHRKPRWRSLPRWQEDWRGLFRCHFRRHILLTPPSSTTPLTSLSLHQEPIFLTPRVSPSNLYAALPSLGIAPFSPLHFLQEPRKAEAPQLRDECRSYRILAGCRESQFHCSMLAYQFYARR